LLHVLFHDVEYCSTRIQSCIPFWWSGSWHFHVLPPRQFVYTFLSLVNVCWRHICSDVHPYLPMFVCTCLNCLSLRMVPTIKPLSLYSWITCSRDLIIVLLFMSFTNFAVPKCIFHDMLITNGIFCWTLCQLPIHILMTLKDLGSTHRFSFSHPRLGPNMSSHLWMSCLVTMQFGSRFLST